LYVLGEHEANAQIYLGRLVQNYIPRGYLSGGAGYVISKPAVRKIVDEGRKFPADCPKDGAIEDLEIGSYVQSAVQIKSDKITLLAFKLHCKKVLKDFRTQLHYLLLLSL